MDVAGTGPFTFQWQRNGVDVAGGTNASLSLSGSDPNAAGRYTLRVGNGHTTQTSDALIVAVRGAPITGQPQNVTAALGAAVELTVGATATPAATYQWSKDGIPLVGQVHGSLLLASVRSRDAGTYTVAVTNSFGTVTSAPATLTVNGMQLDEGFRPAIGSAGVNGYGSSAAINTALRLADGRFLIGGSFTLAANGLRFISNASWRMATWTPATTRLAPLTPRC